jgi:hypothetical protein
MRPLAAAGLVPALRATQHSAVATRHRPTRCCIRLVASVSVAERDTPGSDDEQARQVGARTPAFVRAKRASQDRRRRDRGSSTSGLSTDDESAGLGARSVETGTPIVHIG